MTRAVETWERFWFRETETSTLALFRIAFGIVVLAVVWIVLQFVLGMVFAVIRAALLVVLFGIVAWVVLVGPPGGRD